MADTDTTSDASPVYAANHRRPGAPAARVLTFDRKLVDGKTGEILNG